MQGFCNALRQELHKATITVSCPGYVNTNFHQTASDGWEGAPGTRKRSMSAAQCAALSVEAMLLGKNELIMTLSGVAGYKLRPWLPDLVDYFARRKSVQSLSSS
jgi:short-subunit dehydrogenase